MPTRLAPTTPSTLPVLLLGVLLCAAGAAQATTYKVGTASATCASPTHATIAAAITAAAGSTATPHTIQICPGTYGEGGLTLNNSRHNGITVTSTTGVATDVTVAAGSASRAFDINGRANVTLSHLTITGSNQGVYVQNWSSGTTLNDLAINVTAEGVETNNVSNFSLTNSTIVSSNDGVDMEGDAGGVNIDNVTITAGTGASDSGIEISNVYTSLSITRATVTRAGYDGIQIGNGNSLTPTLRDLNITATRYGFYANNLRADLGVATLTANTITAGQTGVYLTGDTGAFQVRDTTVSAGTGSTNYHGIHATGAYGVWRVTRATVSRAGGHGIYVSGGSAPVIEDVAITASQDGINIANGNGPVVQVATRARNSIVAGNRGIYLSGGIGNFKIYDSDVQGGTDSTSDYGILTANTWADYEIKRNIVRQTSGDGIYVQGDSSAGVISDNLIQNAAGHGLRLGSGPAWATATIYNNCFYNGNNVYNNYRSAPYNSGTSGNYWGSWPAGSGYSDTCVDANSNGVCDTAYTVPGVGGAHTSYDNYPRKTCPVVPTMTIATPGAATEGNSGTSTLSFTVSLSTTATATTSATYVLADVSATGGASCAAGVDYINTGGTVTINSGASTGTINITICGDTTYEPTETFTVTLSAPVNATLGSPSSATGTIANDDAVPTVSVAAASVSEGNSGTTTLSFTVSLSNASYQAVSVNYATAAGTATAGTCGTGGADYQNTSGTLAIPAGSTSGTVNVTVCGDTDGEADETLTLTLSSPVNATLGTATATGTIVNDDFACFTDTFTGADGAAPSSDWARTSSSGSFGLPRIMNNRLRLTDASGNVATAAHLQRMFPGAGNKIIVEFDYFAYNGSGADGIALTFSDASVTPSAGAYGGSLGYAQRCGVNGFAGGWLGIGVDEYGNFRNDSECRGDGGSPTGLVPDSVSVRGSGSGTTGYLIHAETGAISPGIDQPGATAGPGHRYRITIDHSDGIHAYVTVERNSGSGYATIVPAYDAKAQSGQAAVPANWLLSYTGSTGGSNNIHEIDNLSVCTIQPILPLGPDHYVISHSGSALTCEAEPVTFTAHGSNHSRADAGGKTLSISTGAGAGSWVAAADGCAQTCYNASGTATGCNGTFTATSGNNGQASYAFASGETGVRLCLRHNASGTLNINVTDGAATESTGTASAEPSPGADPGLVFGDTGFRFYADGTVDTLGNFTAGLRSDTVNATWQPTPQSIVIRALKSSQTTPPRCVALLGAGSRTIQFAYQCVDPATCHASSNGLEVNGAAVAAAASPASNVAVAFDGTGSGAINLKYWDVGKIQLAASASVADGVTGGNAVIVAGSSNAFLIKPYGFTVKACTGATPCTVANAAATDGSGSVFVKAGDTFNATVAAVAYDGGVVTPSFGLGSGNTTETANLTHALVAPAAGNAGALGGTAAIVRSTFADGVASISNLTWSEVGVMTLTAANTTFQTVAAAASGTSGNIGRFAPHHFGVTGSVVNRSDLAAPGGGFNYMGEPMRLTLAVTAYNKSDAATQNYRAAFAKLDATTLGAATANWTCTSGSQCMGLGISSGGDLTGRLAIDTASANSATPTNTTLAGGTTVGWLNGTSYFTFNATFARAAAPDGPFATLKFGAKPLDSDSVTLPPRLSADTAHCVNLDISTGTENAACNPGATESNLRRKLFENALRFGRLHLLNAYGPELLPARVEGRAEYWDGNRWALNTDDSGTRVPQGGMSASGGIAAGTCFLTHPRPSSPTNAACQPSAPATAFAGGHGYWQIFDKTPAQTGFADMTIDLGAQPWLRGLWSGAGTTYTQDPTARVRFGSPKAPYIYLRERY